MGLLDRLRGGKPKTNALDAVLLEDEALMARIDEYRSGAWDGERDDHPDACRSCGYIDPGYRRCRRCDEPIKRKVKGDFGLWYQEVAGESYRQESFKKMLMGAPRDTDGGVYQWVTAVLLPEPTNQHDRNAVKVLASTDGPADHVGYIPKSDARAIQKVCQEVYQTHRRAIACKGLVSGGFVLPDGTRASYGIRLLLPATRALPNAVGAALNDQR